MCCSPTKRISSRAPVGTEDRKSTRLNSSHANNSYAVFCLKKKIVTFLVLYGGFTLLKPPRLGELAGLLILINGQPIRLPVEPVIRLGALVGSLVIAVITASAMAAEWTTLALYWYARGDAVRAATAGAVVDPIFGRPLTFYFFTLPAWQLLS